MNASNNRAWGDWPNRTSRSEGAPSPVADAPATLRTAARRSLVLPLLFLALLQFACGTQGNSQASAQQEEQEMLRLREENKDLPRLRKENEEVQKLRQENLEISKLRGQYQELQRLRKENEQLRTQLQRAQPAAQPAKP